MDNTLLQPSDKQEKSSTSSVPSMGNTNLGKAGRRLTDHVHEQGHDTWLFDCVYATHYYDITTKSDYARANAGYIAMAAHLGLITTLHLDGCYGNTWHVTSDGLAYLEEATQDEQSID